MNQRTQAHGYRDLARDEDEFDDETVGYHDESVQSLLDDSDDYNRTEAADYTNDIPR